jgi:DNA topoisomerase-3
MNISMDKYKTSELGKALKKVFHNEMNIDDTVKLAEKEISEVFNKKELPLEKDEDNGFYGDIIGTCPKCGKNVIRNRYGYGCIGYKDGCDFKISGVICKRVISKGNAIKLLKEGKTSKIEGFISKKGTTFNAYLILKDNKIEFSF